MRATTDEGSLPPELEPEYDTTGLFTPEWGREWADEIRRREAAHPEFAETIDAEAAFALVLALLKRS